MTATRYHSLIVEERKLPADLEVSAWTTEKDGSRTIMGLRHRKFQIEGVQFHPESVLTSEGKEVGRKFSGAVKKQWSVVSGQCTQQARCTLKLVNYRHNQALPTPISP